MVLLHSNKNDLGKSAPNFKLTSVEGKSYTLKSFDHAKVLVVMFLCNHCPYVKAIESRIVELQRYFEKQSVQLVAVCSNDSTNYPEDSPENLKRSWLEKDYRFPYLVDESQAVAKSFGAVCTPDIFLYDSNRKLAYHGRFDDNWQEPAKVTSEDLKEAIRQLLEGESIQTDQRPSMGCSIKWK